jgi:hypothetical protein
MISEAAILEAAAALPDTFAVHLPRKTVFREIPAGRPEVKNRIGTGAGVTGAELRISQIAISRDTNCPGISHDSPAPPMSDESNRFPST